jgi:hypothetical protein
VEASCEHGTEPSASTKGNFLIGCRTGGLSSGAQLQGQVILPFLETYVISPVTFFGIDKL